MNDVPPWRNCDFFLLKGINFGAWIISEPIGKKDYGSLEWGSYSAIIIFIYSRSIFTQGKNNFINQNILCDNSFNKNDK